MPDWKRWVAKWWWLCLCALSALFYFHAIKGKKIALSEYAFRLEEMDKIKLSVLQEREELRLKIASQADPAWIEMILMRDLGVVPEGWLKVHFKK